MAGLAAAMIMTSAATACSRTRTGEAGGTIAPADAVSLHVQNDNFLDVDVYAVIGGQARRLGTVVGHTGSKFALNPSVATQDLYLVATPIGGSGRASSGRVAVSPGDTIIFTVGAILRNSTVSIR